MFCRQIPPPPPEFVHPDDTSPPKTNRRKTAFHPSSRIRYQILACRMEPEGQRASTPSAALAAAVRKREKLQDELRSIEKQVYDLETSYLHDSSQFGNVLKGFEGFLSSSKSTTNLKRSRKFQAEDRLFSLSSVTSPAVEEHAVGRDEYGVGRSKGGFVPANGQGKQKKGRTASRDGKKIRPNELELDGEDHPDLGLR